MASNLIFILNGPNLNLLGTREPDIYGAQSLKDVEDLCVAHAKKAGFDIRFLQSNMEGQLVDWIQEARHEADAIVINPAAYSHTSIAILDALKNFDGPVAEVHISNINQRETFRHHSYVSLRANCVIAGCGILGYGFAVDYLAQTLSAKL